MSMLVVAHLSDLHLDGTPNSSARCRTVLGHLRALTRPVDVVLVTGDVADRGRPEAYAEAAELLAGLPALVCPGNHDDGEEFRAVFRGAPVLNGTGHQVHERGGAVFVLLDSTLPGESAGGLSGASLTWLDETLSDAGEQPAFVALHHPPVSLGRADLDEVLLRAPEQFERVIQNHSNVVAVLAGHAHTAAATTFGWTTAAGRAGGGLDHAIAG